MINFLLISGSPRKGNTDFILKKIFNSLKGKKELVFLRDKNIEHCSGCLNCDNSGECYIADDMQDLYKKMLKADVFIIGSPNYFNNVSGLLKDFIDRTTVFYKSQSLKGKKMFTLMVGASKKNSSKEAAEKPLTYFAKAHKIEHLDHFYFQAVGPRDIQYNLDSLKTINQIIVRIQKLK